MYPEDRLSHNWLIKRAVNIKAKRTFSTFHGKVLDLGCGTRPFELDILEYATSYVGVDWSNSLHDLKAELLADLNKPIPIQSNSIDHIVSFELLEHLCEPHALLSEAFRILKPGGTVAMSTPFQWWVHEEPWDYYRFTCFGLSYMFTKAGFSSIRIEPTTGFWSMWFLKLNYQTRRLASRKHWSRALIRTLFTPIWWLNQHLALFLDKHWPEDRETAGYFVTAKKP